MYHHSMSVHIITVNAQMGFCSTKTMCLVRVCACVWAWARVNLCLERHVTTSSNIPIYLRWFSLQTFKRKIQIPQPCLGVRLHYDFLACICRSTISHSCHGFQHKQCLFSACENETTWIYHSMTRIQPTVIWEVLLRCKRPIKQT